MKNQKGFTLVELMVVVAIIGILSSIAIPNFQRFQRKSRQSEAKSLLGGIYAAEKAFFQEWNQYYSDLDVIGFLPNGQLRYESGFAAAGPSPITATILGYTGPASSGLFRTGLVCASAFFASQCTKLPNGVTVAPANAVNPIGAGAGATFTAAAETTPQLLGGAQNDQWTMNQLGVVANPLNGL
jgi:type IV pilus assembly protein PilA